MKEKWRLFRLSTGGVFGILAELNRAGLIHGQVPTVHSKTLGQAITEWDAATWDAATSKDLSVSTFYSASPGGIPTQEAFSQDRHFDTLNLDRNDGQDRHFDTLNLDRNDGCIRDKELAYSQDGGLAVLYGNVAEKGCIVKTAGVDESAQRCEHETSKSRNVGRVFVYGRVVQPRPDVIRRPGAGAPGRAVAVGVL